MTWTIKGEITGLKDVLGRLAKLASQTTRSRILRRAVDVASRPMLRAARQLVRVNEGWLKRSLGRRIQTYRKTGVVMAIIGARSGFIRTKKGGVTSIRLTAFGRKLLTKTQQRPTHYAHLVELGTRRSRPFPFLSPAFERHKADAAETMRQLIEAGIAEAAR